MSDTPLSPMEGPAAMLPAVDRSPTPSDTAANPMLVVISGPSGVGKDTIIAALQERGHRPEYHYVVTCTTRGRRPGEIDGVSYNFVTPAEFAALRDAGELLEANEVHGNWYGTPRAGVREALSDGRHAILKIDVQGARVVKSCVPEALLIFVVPPTLDTLAEHLKARRVNEEGRVDLTAERIEQIIDQEERRGSRRAVTV